MYNKEGGKFFSYAKGTCRAIVHGLSFASLITLFIVSTATLFLNEVVHADTERVVRYEYDEAGNIIRTLSLQLDAAPHIDQLTPSFINVDSSNIYSATGTDLFGVAVISDDFDITVTEVQSTRESVTFQVRAGENANVGNATLIFSNSIGQTQQPLFVVEPAPELVPHPSPIIVSSDNVTKEITLIFSTPRPEDEAYSIAISNPSVVFTSIDTATVLAGQDQITVPLSGLSEGVTDLIVRLDAKFAFYSFPVFVGTSFEQLLIDNEDMRQRNLLSPTVGVYVRKNSLTGTNTVLSQPVGVSYLQSSGQFFSKQVSISYLESSGRFVSAPVGILYSSIANPVLSRSVDLIYGAVVTELERVVANANFSVSLDIDGFNLDEISSITVTPSSGVTVDLFAANNGGTRLSLTLSIAAGAASGLRQLQLNGSNGSVINHTGKPLFFEIQ